ncbi:MAG: hypothetical protein ACREEJ_07005 [Ensifer adhaerens]
MESTPGQWGHRRIGIGNRSATSFARPDAERARLATAAAARFSWDGIGKQLLAVRDNEAGGTGNKFPHIEKAWQVLQLSTLNYNAKSNN